MSHTYESVLKFFGDKVQIVAGGIIIHENGKNVEVGAVNNGTGVFSITAAGFELLSAEKQAPAKNKAVKDVVPNLGLDSLE